VYTVVKSCIGVWGFDFNSMERDDKLSSQGNAYDFGARIYDSRLRRWMSVDPLYMKYPFSSPYSFALNKPILFIDIDGRDIVPTNQFNNSRYSCNQKINMS
jgi:RHS repeat-associated protein